MHSKTSSSITQAFETRWLHVPMEIVDRELYPKLLLISEAVKDGWHCVLGTKRALIDAAADLPPGVVYLKSVIPNEYEYMMTFKRNGHRLISLDEEGLIQSSLETLVTARYCEKTVAETEKFFCWGDIQREALQDAYKPYADRFTTTGSPTADLWTLKAKDIYKEQVDDLHNRFGKYILIPSSFAVPNHFMGPEEALGIMKRDNMFRNQEDYDYYKRYHDYVGKVFHEFLELFPILAKEFQDYTIILRPHPSDNHETWKKATRGLDNVRVLFEGPVSPWLAGAEAVVHWGSTTGLEAYLLGRPVIAYTPYPEEEKAYDVLPHLVSIMTHARANLLEDLRYVLENPDDWLQNYPDVLAGHEELKKWIFNMGNPPAIRTIMDAIGTMNVEPQALNNEIKVRRKKTSPKEIIWKGLAIADKSPGISRIFTKRIQLGLKSREFGRHKTKDINQDEVLRALRQLSDVPMSAEKLADNLYLIRAA